MNSVTDVRALTAEVRATMASRRRQPIRRRPRYGTYAGSADGHRTVRLTSHAHGLHATFAPELGLLGVSLRHRGEELLALPADVETYARTGAATGIPFLHPWANRLEGLAGDNRLLQYEEHGLPIHGVAAGLVDWRVRRSGVDRLGAWLVAELDWSGPELEGVFPHPHRVRLEARGRDATLSIRTTVAPTADVAVPIAFGHHPYLRLPGVERADWEVGLPARGRLTLDDSGLPAGECERLRAERARLGERTFDDLFEVGDDPVAFELAGNGRQVTVRFGAGYPYAQIFAPAGKKLICFEPMTAPVNALHTGEGLRRIAPGATFRAEWSIGVRNAGL